MRIHRLPRCIFRGRQNASGSMLLLGPALRIHRLSRCMIRSREDAFGRMLLLGAALRIHRLSRCIFRGYDADGSILFLRIHRLSRCIFRGREREHAPSKKHVSVCRAVCCFWAVTRRVAAASQGGVGGWGRGVAGGMLPSL